MSIENQSGKYVEITESVMAKIFPDILREIWHYGSVEDWQFLIKKRTGKLKIKRDRKRIKKTDN